MGEEPGHRSTRGAGIRTLFRLRPYLRPWRAWIIGSAAAAMLAMLCGLAVPLVMQRILDGPVAHHDTAALPWLVLGVIAFGGTEAAMFYVRRRLIASASTGTEVALRRDLYDHLQRLPIAFHDRWQSGQLLSRGVSDLSTLRRFVAFVGIFLVINSVTLVIGMVILFVLSPAIGIVALVGALPLVGLSMIYEKRFSVLARRAQDQQGDLATVVEESVLGIRVLKAFGRGPELARRFAAQARVLRGTELEKKRVFAMLWAVIILLPEAAIALMLLVGALAITHQSMTVGTLVAAVTVATYLRWPTDSIGWLLAETSQAATACERYWEVRDAPVDIVDPDQPRPLPERVTGLVRFEDVHYAYRGDDGERTEVLRGVDLELRPGETVALVGATGCGKTTLTALVPRLADVTGGRITVDGIDVRSLRLADLRSVVATAFEEPVLFSASVRENVALGGTDTTDAQVREALRVSSALEFVEALPWGLDTRIGEQGLSLSGGQRQRLALARAVVGRPAVLVLDDPLSALDVHTEAEVERALRSVLREVTALVVAHRPSTVQLADRVALLDHGRIVATGTHSELLRDNPDYRHLLSTMEHELAGERA